MNLQEVLNVIPLNDTVMVISHTPKVIKYIGKVNTILCTTFLIHGRKVMKVRYSKEHSCITIDV